METKSFIIKFLPSTSSYPTYEEWKHSIRCFFNQEGAEGSYPTYEEWKLPNFGKAIDSMFLFLSYL